MNRIIKISILTITLFLGMSASASKWYINDASVVGDVFCSKMGTTGGTGTAANPFLTLNSAIVKAVAGDTIFIDAGTYSGSGNRDLTVNIKNLNVIGAGMAKTVFDNNNAGTTGRYFLKIENAMVMSNLKIARYGIESSSSPAHAIDVKANTGPVIINNVQVDNNGRSSGNYVIEIKSGATVTFNGGGLTCNKNWENSGGIRITGTATVKMNNYQFINNYRNANGAVVRLDGGDLEITHSRFEGNKGGADLAGTAIYVSSGTLLVDNSSFDYNYYNIFSNNIGGLIRIAGGSATLSNSVFKNTSNFVSGNNAYGTVGVTGSSILDIENCLFEGNLCGRANDIYNNGGAISINNTTFKSTINQIGSNAGTISISQSGNPSINPAYNSGISIQNTLTPTFEPDPATPGYLGKCPNITIQFSGPTANDDSKITNIGIPVNIAVLENDVAGSALIEPSSVSFVAGTAPNPVTTGTFSVDPLIGLVSFTPVSGFFGIASIDYQVCDQNALCDVATITITVVAGGINLYPATGPGSLAFEDLWPSSGDFDFNDMVIDYQFATTINALNLVDQITATFVLKAFGASYNNGFGFQLSPDINLTDITVTGSSLHENIITLEANGLESGQTTPTIIVFDNTFALMQHPGSGVGVNTSSGAPYVAPVTVVINIVLKPNTYSYNDLDISNFNPFIFVNKVRSHEVHLPFFPPTDLADEELFGQSDDVSNPATGKYYVTVNNLPFAINLYESFDYPGEKQEIGWGFLKFTQWAESGGQVFMDWYRNLPGYRNENMIYQKP
jgi:LruC domain-containing protein